MVWPFFSIHARRPVGLPLGHQQLEDALRGIALALVQAHLDQAPRVGIHRGLLQLLGVHLAQALEAPDVTAPSRTPSSRSFSRIWSRSASSSA